MNRTYDEAAFVAEGFRPAPAHRRRRLRMGDCGFQPSSSSGLVLDPIVLTGVDEGELRVVAELVEVLGVGG